MIRDRLAVVVTTGPPPTVTVWGDTAVVTVGVAPGLTLSVDDVVRVDRDQIVQIIVEA